MNNVVQIGPLMLATDRLAAIILLWIFLGGTAFIARRLRGGEESIGWWAAGIGLIGARIAYVLQNLEVFQEQPVSALFLWQGGFSAWYGIAAAAIFIALKSKGRARGAMLGVLGACALGWLGFTQLTARTEARPVPAGLAVTKLAGERIALDTMTGRPYVINLWATWCPPCRREMPMLIDMARRTSDIPILLVNQGETAPRIQAFLRKEGLSADAVRLDGEASLGAAVNSPALPTTLFVDAQGNIVRTHVGEISRAAMADGLRSLRRGQ